MGISFGSEFWSNFYFKSSIVDKRGISDGKYRIYAPAGSGTADAIN